MPRVLKRKGLDYFKKTDRLESLVELMRVAFTDCDPLDIISTMDDSTQYFIKKDNNKIVALLSLVEKGGMNRFGEEYPNMIFNVATDPRYRRQGFMKLLFERMKKDVLGEINLEVFVDNKPAIRLYKNLGFKKKERLDPKKEKSSYMMKKTA